MAQWVRKPVMFNPQKAHVERRELTLSFSDFHTCSLAHVSPPQINKQTNREMSKIKTKICEGPHTEQM